MKFRNISDLQDEDLRETPFEFLIMKLNDICLVTLNRKFKDLDLTINQANFLVVINTEECLPQSYISQLLNIRGGSVTKALKRLEAKDLVEIIPNPENKSKNIVKITDKGRKVTLEFKKTITEIENEIFLDYSEDEKEKLKIMLRDLSKKYLELNKTP
ncbi:MarR family winged helix-turn-helix transcriptional regulator [Methanobrevibacter sp.]|uniref:MarR family winged helix-turn-helix transcriptional regulator n=1 Tax=Methanobrevibacter sp. TaxID=66852 RepID=UPI0038902522